jgi:hypothetical protein
MTSVSDLDAVAVSGRELAAWLALTDRRVRQLAEAGVLRRARKGLYPLKASVSAYLAWTERPRDAVDLHEAKRRKAAAEAELLELELARQRGGLIQLEDLMAALAPLITSVRDRIRETPANALVRVPGFTKPMALAFRKLLDEALHEIADGKLRAPLEQAASRTREGKR